MKDLKSVNGSILKNTFEFFGFAKYRDERQFVESVSYLINLDNSKEHKLNHIENAVNSLIYSDCKITPECFWITPINENRFDSLASLVFKYYDSLTSSEFDFSTKVKFEHSPKIWALVQRGSKTSGQTELDFSKNVNEK